jgi:hypothetical protein
MRGYWTLTWFGLISNTIAIPFIAFVVGSGPPFQTANITLAISLAWPAAVRNCCFSRLICSERMGGDFINSCFVNDSLRNFALWNNQTN